MELLRVNLVRERLLRGREAFLNGDLDRAWVALSEAHILAQPSAYLHSLVHYRMLVLALRTFHLREVWGQLLRLLVAAPGSWSGRYPRGNTGRSHVSMFQPMAIPESLEPLTSKLAP